MTTPFRATVAIDFGTANSGGAYVIALECEEIQSANLDGNESQKTPTRIALRKRYPHEFVAFGHDVLGSYNAEHDLIFHSFKMTLYQSDAPETVQADVGDGEVPVRILITRCLEHLSQATIASILDMQGVSLQVSDIQWVLTVPAIWSEKSKNLMTECASAAGLCHSEDSLVLALEPECAALETHATNSGLLKIGDRYLVVDCGGGTVDTAAFEVEDELPDLKLKALHRPDGGGWGATAIDDNFMELIYDLLHISPEARKNNMTLYDFKQNVWLPKKLRFGRQSLQATGRITFSIGTLIDEFSGGQSIDDLVRQFNQKHPGYEMEKMGANVIRFTSEALQKLFKPAIDNTVGHVRKLLDRISDVKYVVLVGGFGGNRVLQDQLRQAIQSYNATLVLARNPSISIVMGAVRYGLNPNIITIRRSPLTYGIRTTEMCPTGKFEALGNVSQGFAQQHRKSHPGGHGFVLRNYFWKMVTINDEVKPGHPFEKEFFPASGHDKFKVVIVATSRSDPILTTEPDVKEVGTLKITVPPMDSVEQRCIVVAVELGTTHITVTATVKATGMVQQSTVEVSYT